MATLDFNEIQNGSSKSFTYGDYDAIDFGVLDVGDLSISRSSDGGSVVIHHVSGGEVIITSWGASKTLPIKVTEQSSSTTYNLVNAEEFTGAEKNPFIVGKPNGDNLVYAGLSEAGVYGGIGSDVVNSISSVYTIIDGGDGADVLRSFNDTGTGLLGDDGDDVLTIYGNNVHDDEDDAVVLEGDAGNDTYKVMSKLVTGSKFVIEQNYAGSTDKDRLILAKMSKKDVSYALEDRDLLIESSTGGQIRVTEWTEHALSKIVFKDGVVTTQEINTYLASEQSVATEIAANTTTYWAASSTSNKVVLQGFGINLTITSFNAATVVDYAALDTSEWDFEHNGDDLVVTFNNEDDESSTSIVTFKNYFTGTVYPHIYDGDMDIVITAGTSGDDTINLNTAYSVAEGEALLYLGDVGNDKITATTTTNAYAVSGGAGNDELNLVSDGKESQLRGGIGSDTYTITWHNGDDVEIYNVDYSSGDQDTINITNRSSSEFTFEMDENKLKLYDINGGRIKIQLTDAGLNSANFQGINFKDGESLTVSQISGLAAATIKMNQSITYNGTEAANSFMMTAEKKYGNFAYNIANFGDEDKIVADQHMMESWGTVTYGGYTQEGNNLLVQINSLVDGVDTQIGTICLQDYFKDSTTRQLTVMGETVNVVGVNKEAASDVILNFMSSLDSTTQTGFNAVDEAIVACSNGLYGSLSALISSYKNDVLTYSGSTLEQQKQFLLDYCGINLDNEDTGAITGADAGGNTVKTAASIVAEPENVTVADFTYDPETLNKINASYYTITTQINGNNVNTTTSFSGSADTKDMYAANVNGVTFYWDESGWEDLGVDTATLRQVVGGVINGWAEGSMNLVNESYGMSMTETGSNLYTLSDGTKGMQICLINAPIDTVAQVGSNSYTTTWSTGASSTTTYEYLMINTYYYQDSITDVNGNSSAGQVYLDRTIAHEMVHGVMAANIESFGSLPSFLKEGLAELVHGVDDERQSDILNLTNTAYSGDWTSSTGVTTTYDLAGLIDAVFNQDIANASMGTETYGGGYLLLRYLAKQVSDKTTVETQVSSFADAMMYSDTLEDSTTNTDLMSSFKSLADANLTFADDALAATESLTTAQEKNDVQLQISGNMA